VALPTRVLILMKLKKKKKKGYTRNVKYNLELAKNTTAFI